MVLEFVVHGAIISHQEIYDLPQYQYTHPHDQVCAAYLFEIDTTTFPLDTTIYCTPTLHYTSSDTKGQQTKQCSVDNLQKSKSAPLSFYHSSTGYLHQETTAYIDMHAHSLHTRDHVEFGAPLKAISVTTKALGLTATAVIDHSYDLSCNSTAYLQREDSNPTNYYNQQHSSLTYKHSLFVGEELSTRFSYKKSDGAIHLGVVGNKTFLAGTADGARRGYQPQKEPLLAEAITTLHNEGGICYAAHPGEVPPLIHRLLLRRGSWKQHYFTLPIDAFQGVNSGFNASWIRAKKLWIQLLLRGKRIPLLGGNDAHVDFNRYRALAIPFLSLKEDIDRYLGATVTGFYNWDFSGGKEQLIKAIKEKRTFVTTGPFLDIQHHHQSRIGEEVTTSLPLTLVAKSTEEFGYFTSISLYVGKKENEQKWSIPLPRHLQISSYTQSIIEIVDIASIPHASYLRVEATTSGGYTKKEGFVVTSPLYFTS